MKKNKQIAAWLKMGVGRGTALAIALRSSRQYIHQLSLIKKSISENQWSAIMYAIELVELDERKNQKAIEHNIIKAALMSHSKDSDIRNYALIQLDKWVHAIGVYHKCFGKEVAA